MKERELQAAVIEAAQLFGWLVHHVKPARTPDGEYLTRIQGDRGFPDLCIARRGVVIFAELKSEKGRIRPDQQAWLDALNPDPGDYTDIEVRVWRPDDWTSGRITETLR